MRLTRRDFATLLAAGAAGAVIPRSLFALNARVQDRFFEWRSVGPGIEVAFGQGGNAMLVRDGGEALLVDSKNLGYGFLLRNEADRPDARLAGAVNTHHHGDHIGGNAAFTSDVPLLAHPTARTRIRNWAEGVVGEENESLVEVVRQMREEDGNPAVIEALERAIEQIRTVDAERFVPTREVAEAEELSVGGRTVLLRYVGAGHTDNDVFVFLPDDNVLHTGDLLFNGRHGFMDQNGGVTSEGWQRSLQAMLELVDGESVVVPGHGEITDRAGLQRQWDYFEQLREAVGAGIAQGLDRGGVMGLRPESLADVQGDPSRNLGVVFDELTEAPSM